MIADDAPDQSQARHTAIGVDVQTHVRRRRSRCGVEDVASVRLEWRLRDDLGPGPAAQGKRPGRQPPEHLRKRVETYFDPLPFYYEPLEAQLTDVQKYPLNAVTQRPMAMYHSWDSQNAWLRQIHAHNYLYVNPATAASSGVGDGDWI